jgi:acyl-coenzyme A synthetase/AMP-(fatty) acid ligase
MTHRMGLGLHAHGGRPCLLRDGVSTSYAELASLSDTLVDHMRSRAIQRAIVQSDDPVDVIRALDACDRLGVDLYIAHTTLRPDTVRQLIERFSIQMQIGICEQMYATSVDPCVQKPHVFLMTSGTTGEPKIARYSLDGVIGRLRARAEAGRFEGSRWLLTYQATSYAGLQVLLTAILAGSQVVSTATRTPQGFYETARRTHVSHISATATFWRSLLMQVGPDDLSLQQVTVGGESIDQRTIDRLLAMFPQAHITHTYASTEAGFVHAVSDGRAGFPSKWLDNPSRSVQVRIRDGLLQVKSPHTMQGYASAHPQVRLEDGWLATADRCEVRGDRAYIIGRDDSTVNVAGSKIYPATVERFLLSLPNVAEVRVYGLPNPVTGSILGADVVLVNGNDPQITTASIIASCRAKLAPYAVPHVVKIVDQVAVRVSGKKA